jgi:MraZ protein
MFRGSHQTRMDEKGRLKMPADLKRELDELYGPKFYLTSLDGKRAKIYPLKTWESIEQSLQKLATTDPIRKRFLDVTNYYGQMAEMDAQGRLLIPQLLRDTAKAIGEVRVLGVQDHLELVNEADFAAELKGANGVIALTESENAALAEKTQPKDS